MPSFNYQERYGLWLKNGRCIKSCLFCTCYDNESICNVWCNYIRPLRGFVSHDHILTVLISFQRRTLYENIKKIPKFKRWNIWFVSLPNKSLLLKKYILKFKADLIVKLLTIQPYLNYLKIDKKNDKSGCFFLASYNHKGDIYNLYGIQIVLRCKPSFLKELTTFKFTSNLLQLTFKV